VLRRIPEDEEEWDRLPRSGALAFSYDMPGDGEVHQVQVWTGTGALSFYPRSVYYEPARHWRFIEMFDFYWEPAP
jgi:hypothetical protein